MAEPENHEDCAAFVRDGMAKLGCDVTVSTAPPIVATPYDNSPLRCPHGVTFWMAPTSEQIAQWAKDGVP